MKRIPTMLFLAFSAALALQPSASVAKDARAAIGEMDTDNDGTLDLKEIKSAADGQFSMLEKDSDGTLDAKELRGKMSRKDMTAADPDKDGTVSRDEYLTFVEKLFGDVDSDDDATIDAKELKTKKGKALIGLTH